MTPIAYLQSIPTPILSYGCPLLIIGCFLVSFRHWLQAKWYGALYIYSLSIFTYAIIKTVTREVEPAALIGGVLAPAFYSFCFVCYGAVRSLRMPYGYGRTVRSTVSPRKPMLLLRGAIGGCVGGVTGAALGMLFSLLLLMLLPLFAGTAHQQILGSMQQAADNGIFLFGLIGVGVGGLAGLNCFSLKQVSDRLLIYSAIHLYVIRSSIKRFLNYCRKRRG